MASDEQTQVRSRSPNTSGMVDYQKRKAEDKLRRATESIDLLWAERRSVNFRTVALEAGVTKSYLYSCPALRQRIEALRGQQGQARLVLVSSGELDRRKTDRSKDVLIEAQAKRIRELKEENKRLQEDVKRLHGRLYEARVQEQT